MMTKANRDILLMACKASRPDDLINSSVLLWSTPAEQITGASIDQNESSLWRFRSLSHAWTKLSLIEFIFVLAALLFLSWRPLMLCWPTFVNPFNGREGGSYYNGASCLCNPLSKVEQFPRLRLLLALFLLMRLTWYSNVAMWVRNSLF